ncbi:E3 ubiquitin-protein ligase RNF14-like [Papaver somniferum]|uniref:E3 ubiquitin-protein ligase RNF14-like n=1 Tax=Papaver somniferum TaxID=3469 RepID=UPI000E7029B9|nr:E3 ubiquitin-protein ligase RNF14-like [Papaver somniferum]
MAESLLVVVDDFYFAVLSVGSDDGVEEDVFPISDEKYAEQLCLQEALMCSVRTSTSPGVTNSSSNPHYRKSEIGESSSSRLKIEDTYKNTSNSNDTKMKSTMNVNASAGDDQYSSEMSFCEICMEAKPTSEMRKSTIKCSHIYCFECIAKHIAAKIQDNISQITCLEFNCKEILEPHLCRDIIPAQVFDRWENALCESLILASHKIYCPSKDCSAMLVNDDDGVIIRESECPHCR